jgi:hypothetical protein
MLRFKMTLLAIAFAFACNPCLAQLGMLGGIDPYSDEFHNPLDAADVDGNGLVQPRDVLLVINRLQLQETAQTSLVLSNSQLLQPMASVPPGLSSYEFDSSSNPGSLSLNSLLSLAKSASPAAALPPAYFWDTTGDGVVSPRDALLVINALNAVSHVPEPSTLLLGGVGLLLLLTYSLNHRRRVAC